MVSPPKALNRITRFKGHLRILLLAALAFPAAGAMGTTVTLEPVKDNTIFSERLVLHWFQPQCGIEPFLPERFPAHIWKVEDGTEFYGVPYDGEVKNGVKVAIHNKGTPCDPDTVQRDVTEGDIERMRNCLAATIPTLAGPCLHSVTCLYSQSPQGDFILGPHPACEDLVLGVGFSGHGYKFCPVIGEILADFATNGSTNFNLDPFSPSKSIHV